MKKLCDYQPIDTERRVPNSVTIVHKIKCKIGSVAKQKGPVSKAIHVECSQALKDLYLQRAMAVHTRNQQDRAYRKLVAVPKKTVCPTIVNLEV